MTGPIVKTPADAVKRLRGHALECLGTRVGMHLHAEADAVERLADESATLRARAEAAEAEVERLRSARAPARATVPYERRTIAIAIGHHFWKCASDDEAADVGLDAARDVMRALAGGAR